MNSCLIIDTHCCFSLLQTVHYHYQFSADWNNWVSKSCISYINSRWKLHEFFIHHEVYNSISSVFDKIVGSDILKYGHSDGEVESVQYYREWNGVIAGFISELVHQHNFQSHFRWMILQQVNIMYIFPSNMMKYVNE